MAGISLQESVASEIRIFSTLCPLETETGHSSASPEIHRNVESGPSIWPEADGKSRSVTTGYIPSVNATAFWSPAVTYRIIHLDHRHQHRRLFHNKYLV
jgi:hypothetical protein